MLKKYRLFCFLSLLYVMILPISLQASTLYTVSVISSNGSEQSLGTYSNYEQAKQIMYNHNSDQNHVAIIKENGIIINAKYAIVRLSYDKNNPLAENGNNEHRLFSSADAQSSYTTVHAAYANDAAFIDYDIYNKRAKIKISGYTGWMNSGYYTVVPISLLESSSWIASKDQTWLKETGSNTVTVASKTPIAIRGDHYTYSSLLGYTTQNAIYTFYDKYYDGTYTWYKVGGSSLKTYYEAYTTDCLLHYYATYNSQGYTNLGKTPSFMTKGKRYYSFDGNYFYESLLAMLNDYRSGGYSGAVNQEGYYPYYLYLPNHTKTRYTADDFNQIIKNYGYNSKQDSAMYGEGSNFILSQKKYGVNALLTFSAALNESAAGTSAIAKGKNNLFGHGAYGNDPYASATSYNTVADGIMAHAKMTGTGYNHPNDTRYYGGHYGNKNSGMNVYYATDPYWGEKMAMNAFTKDNNFGLQDWEGNTVGIKTSDASIPIYKTPSTSSSIIYYLNNKNINVSNMPVVVTDKVYNEGTYFYKVYSDTALNENQDIADVDYSFDKSYGYIEEKNLLVKNKQPIIIASDRTIKKGEDIDLMEGVKATDSENGNITSSIEISGTVYTNIPGSYKITYTATDLQQYSVSKTITVTVKGESVPTIEASDKEVVQFTAFDPREGVHAIDDKDGDLTSKIEIIENTVDTSKTGTYKVTYKVQNSLMKSTSKTVSIVVIMNEKPVIHAFDKTILKGRPFDPLEGVFATDKEDGTIDKIEILENTVNPLKEGTYKVTYRVLDSASQTVDKTIQVTVSEKAKEQKEGNFYFDSLKEIDKKLRLKGYQTIIGIDNDLKQDIHYKIIYENVDTGKIIEQNATRITNKKDIPKDVYSPDNKDYTYSWFYLDLDLDLLPLGNYKMYIEAYTDSYYSKSLVNNKMYNMQQTSYTQNSKRAVMIHNNYNSIATYVELKVREKLLAKKTSSYIYNQYGKYTTFEFSGDKLHLEGNVYSYGMDLSKNREINRKIIFENKENYKVYVQSLGYIDSGDYEVVLPVVDSLDKTRAWYKAFINISNIPKGEYIIYLTTESNITDIFEMNEKIGRSLDHVKKKIGNNTYRFVINKDKGNRIEMIVT